MRQLAPETLVQRLPAHGDRTAILDGSARWTYAALDAAASGVAAGLRARAGDATGRAPSSEPRIAFSVPPGFEYVAVLLGIWKAGGVAVPLALSHPLPELEHVIKDAEPALVVVHPDSMIPAAAAARSPGVAVATADELLATAPSDAPEPVPVGARALMVYTSGTTGRPKGVVTSHLNITAQVTALVDAWAWSEDDRTLLALPLHHVHGIINVLASALWVGASCEILPRFDAEVVWTRLASGEVSVFTAVPTMYHRLVESWEAAPRPLRRARSEGCRHLRLMMCGSAALPVALRDRWRHITGHTLLERYGMTEIGMALANPLHGERLAGSVGLPLPRVEVRVVDEHGAPVTPGTAGELEVRGPAVFQEYWRQPEATRAAFRDGWFRTGDVAVYEHGAYRLLGRASVDIIKTGGYKVSALEIEDVLRRHPAVADCAVVAVADPEWGERVCAALELRDAATLKLEELQHWARSQLAPYKVPRDVRCLAALPRNAMGKVLKPTVAALFKGQGPMAQEPRQGTGH
jgi:malonyl-CoA/methylmalonyl-CoA synthetase